MKEHQFRIKKLEEIYEDHIEKIKRNIEIKLKQSSDLVRLEKKKQQIIFGKHEASYARTLALKAELENRNAWRREMKRRRRIR